MNQKILFKPEELIVLVADEHDLIRKTVEACLVKMGINDIIEASNSSNLASVLQNSSFDLIILDLYYADANGFEILQKIRNKDLSSDVPIIAVTGEADRDEIVKAIDLGANDYILKPFQAEELQSKIISVLNKYHSPTEAEKAIRLVEEKIRHLDFENAQKELSSLLEKHKQFPFIHHLQAVLFYRQKNFEAAIEKLKKNIIEFPEFLKNYKTLSDLYLALKRDNDAINALSQELEVNPKQMARQIKLAKLYLKKERFNDALEHLRLALLENNKNPEALFSMGYCYSKNKNLDKSVYYFKRLRRLQPQNSKPLEAIIKVCAEAGKPKVAEFTLKDEIKAFPKRLDTYPYLAQIFFSEDRNEEGLAILELAPKKNPHSYEAYEPLAKYHLKNKEPDKAMETIGRYITATKDESALDKKAELLIQYKFFKDAIGQIHERFKKEGPSLEKFKLLQAGSVKTKQMGKAYFLQRKVMMSGGKDKFAQKTLAQLKAYILQRRGSRKQATRKSAS